MLKGSGQLNLESCIATLKKDADALFLQCGNKTNAKEVLEVVARSSRMHSENQLPKKRAWL